MDESKRFYRDGIKTKHSNVHFQISVKETDLWISAERELRNEALSLILDARQQIEAYLDVNPLIKSSLEPVKHDPFAPPLMDSMIKSGLKAGVGPMAAVAGAISGFVGEGLLKYSPSLVIVENGGDIFISSSNDVTVSIYAGRSPLSGKIGLRIKKDKMPIGVCTSSGTVGHSLSMGNSDAVCVLAKDTALADASATSIGNKIKNSTDLKALNKMAEEIEGVLGAVAIIGNEFSVWGGIELVNLV